MPTDVTLPQWGMGMNDGLVVKWLKQEGDQVEQGDALVEIETAKINSEVEAPAGGTLARIVVPEGAMVDIGTRLAVILAPGEEPADLPEPMQAAGQPGATPAAVTPAAPDRSSQQKRQVTPVARRVAKELGVDVGQLDGTGPGGRITEADVRAAAAGGAPSVGSAAAPPVVPVREVIRLTGIRATISRRMTESWRAPKVTLNTHADVTETVAFLKKLVAEWRTHRIRPQYQDVVLAATARALTQHPKANAYLVGDELHVLDRVNLGVAFAVPDGLLVPVIRDADKKPVLEMAQAVRDIAIRVKSNELTVDELSGATFTVTNMGGYGVEQFDPLLDPPQIGILGLGLVEERPAVVNGEIVIRSIGHLSLTFDHRAWDGAPAGEFLQTLTGLLRDPTWMTS